MKTRSCLFILLLLYSHLVNAQGILPSFRQINEAQKEQKLICSTFLNPVQHYYHSGFSSDSSAFQRFQTSTPGCYPSSTWIRQAILPAGLMVAGVITMWVPENTWFSKYAVRDRIQERWPHFSTTVDNYLQFSPGVAVFVLKAAGVKSRSDLLNQGIILVKSQVLQSVVVTALKQISHIRRPNGQGNQSMPSGHTAEAFQLATMLDMEYRDTSPWISVGGYSAAAATGALRMLNNKHWDSDVLVGAGLGILSTRVVYLTHRYRWHSSSNTVLLPTLLPKGAGVVFAMQL